jgi:positive regulator of sigma E activity
MSVIKDIIKENSLLFVSFILYMSLAAGIVFIAVLVGSILLNVINMMGLLYHMPKYWPVSNVSDNSIKMSDAIGFYLQAFLAVVIGFLTIEKRKEKEEKKEHGGDRKSEESSS